MGRLLVGTASWTDPTLLRSGWYPPSANTAERRLAHYASQFPLVEVDATYYAPPSLATVTQWVQRTPAGFTFNIKAFSLLTGHPTRPSALPADLRPDVTKKLVYPADITSEVRDEIWRRFLAALDPLVAADRLGVLLFGFPPWFTIRRANKDTILEIAERCAPRRIAVELRHASWFAGANAEETLDFLRRNDLPFVCVDMPQGYRSSIPPVLAATSDLAVVRFHGHSDRWESRDIQEKYGYLYSERELAAWAGRLSEFAGQTEATHVLMNNCCADNAQRNAAQLAAMLAGEYTGVSAG